MNSKKKIHVFTSDILPFPGCARSAGGDRSFQVISALREAGHRVTYSMSLDTYLGKTQREKFIGKLSAEDLWCSEHHAEPDIVLARLQPDIVIFCDVNSLVPVRRYARDIVQILDLNGPVHLEALLILAQNGSQATRSGPLLKQSSDNLVTKLHNADYIIAASTRQKYFWAAYCSLAGFSFDELSPLVCPIAYDAPIQPRRPSQNVSVVFAGGFYPWQEPDRFLRATAEYLEKVEGAVFHIFGGPHRGLPNEEHVNSLIEELQRYRCVRYHGYQPIEDLMTVLSEAWCAVELMDRTIERELAITGRTVSFLSAGTPVIYNDFSSLSELIRKYNAGWTVDTEDTRVIGQVLQQLIEGGLPLVDCLSKRAKELAATEFDSKRNIAPLVELCEGPIQRRRSRQRVTGRAPSTKSSLGRVLVIAGASEGHAIVELRIANPMRALQRQGLIEGFTIAGTDLGAVPNDAGTYDAIVVQRTLPNWCYQALGNLGLPFVLEVDDNLLARAAYRDSGVETALIAGLQLCSTITAPNPRLIRMLEKYSGVALSHKACMTPNALPFPRVGPDVRKPEAILWIQSDIAALTNSREAIVAAVEEFSVRNELPIILVGRSVINRPQFTHQTVMGEISFVANLQLQEFSPTSIGVCPLETVADQETIDFISGKSDLKMLLFDGYGHPGIYSNAAPYTESSLLPVGRVIGNSHAEWKDALEYQYREGWRHTPESTARIQDERHIDRIAREAWLPALEMSALPRPVSGSELRRAFAGYLSLGASGPESMSYALGHADLRTVFMSDPNWNASEHYERFGRREGRSVAHSVEAHQEFLRALAKETEERFEEVQRRLATQEELDELRVRLAEIEARSQELETARDAYRAEMEQMGAAAHIYRAELEKVRASLSWKVTGPLRALTKPFLG